MDILYFTTGARDRCAIVSSLYCCLLPLTPSHIITYSARSIPLASFFTPFLHTAHLSLIQILLFLLTRELNRLSFRQYTTSCWQLQLSSRIAAIPPPQDISVQSIMPLFSITPKTLAGPGYVLLNIVRAMNIVGLLAVITSSIVMVVKTVMTSQLYFFDGLSHIITAFICGMCSPWSLKCSAYLHQYQPS